MMDPNEPPILDPEQAAGEAYPLLKQAVSSILKGSDDANAAYDALLARGLSEEEAREEIARVLLATMFHVGAQSDMLERAGGGAGLRPARRPGRSSNGRTRPANGFRRRVRGLPPLRLLQFKPIRQVEPLQELVESRIG